MYYGMPYSYYPVYPINHSPYVRGRRADQNNMMISDEDMEMMEMMEKHMRVTDEIKKKVDRIDERLRKMEQKMMK